MSKIEVNQISSQCGSTLTIGQSGDTVTLACGATQSGFGRTGTVDWDTTAKTASFTAVSGNGYFVNTTSGAVTMTLPASPSAGDIVSVKDYAYTFETNNLTVNRNGSPIGGGSDTDTIVYSTNGDFLTFIYVDGTQGWVLTNDSTNTDSTGAAYIVATGGTITCCGDYKIHTFTGPGTFCVSCGGNPAGSNTVDYLVVAGGGGSVHDRGGGGGAGGYRESSGAASGCYTASPLGACVSALPVTATGYPITVGAGGVSDNTPPFNPGIGGNGSNSVFSTITSTGGGGGNRASPQNGNAGGSGGGAGVNPGASPITGTGGAGNTPPVSPPQGNPGGNSACSPSRTGGGGGATAAGENGSGPKAGGAGATTSISASPTSYAGGGGGISGGSGGLGGGGNGGTCCSANGTSGSSNTGGGAGGGASNTDAGPAGGSGIVIIRYKYQ